MDNETTAGTAVVSSGMLAADVIHQRYAPHTGAQQCSDCGGWILSPQSFFVNNHGPMCLCCYGKREANAEAHGRRSRTVQPLVGASGLDGK